MSGDAEPAGLPFTNPIDAVVGSVPKGDAARSGSSQSCSGMMPTPEEKLAMASSSAMAVALSPVWIDCSPRSADRTGQR